MVEKYCFTVGEEGQQGLDLLDLVFGDQTKYFLERHGLKEGLSVLDIGCGSGVMTQYLAEKVGDSGRVLAIDNSENQILAAKNRCPNHLKNRIEWQVADIYDLERLGKQFDLVYCRFVLHHVHQPRLALSQISKVLQSSGVYIGIEGVVNYAYTSPENSAWGSLNLPIEVAEGVDRNGNIGKTLPSLIHAANMHCIDASIYQPLLLAPNVRQLLLVGDLDSKNHCIENGMTESEWQQKHERLKACVADESILIGFYGANFTASRKR